MVRWWKRLSFNFYLKLGRWVIVIWREPAATAKKR